MSHQHEEIIKCENFWVNELEGVGVFRTTNNTFFMSIYSRHDEEESSPFKFIFLSNLQVEFISNTCQGCCFVFYFQTKLKLQEDMRVVWKLRP